MGNFARQSEVFEENQGDLYWENTVLYTRFESEPPTDLSSSAHTLTDGSAFALETTDVKFGTGAGDFTAGGANNYVEIANNIEFQFGNGPFTIEFWANWDVDSADARLLGLYTETGNQRSWLLWYDTTANKLAFTYSSNGTELPNVKEEGTWSPTVDTYYHIVVQRDEDNILTMFRDGVPILSTVLDVTFHNGTGVVRIGEGDGVAEAINGRLDELRITKNTARYPATGFTPQKEEFPRFSPIFTSFGDPYWHQVVLHTDFETVDIPVDNSVSKHILTLGSGASLDTTNFKFGTTALDTDATVNGYAQVADSADFDLADSQYTIEGWVRFPTAPGASDDCGLVGQWDETSNQRSWLLALENQTLIFEHSTNGTAVTAKSSAWTPSGTTWYHFAASRDGSNLRFFIDGIQLGTATADTATYHNSTAALRIGDPVDWDQGKVQAQFDGVRLTLGVARYTGDFAPPTKSFQLEGADEFWTSVTALLPLNDAAGSYRNLAEHDENNQGASSDTGVTTELTAANLLFDDVVADIDSTDNGMIVVGDPYWDNVVLLTHLDHVTPIDVSKSAHTLTVSSATRDTSDTKFGASSFTFSDGQWISAADSADFDFGSGDFTVEAWVFFDGAPSATDDASILGHYGTSQFSWILFLENQTLNFDTSTNGTVANNRLTVAWLPSATTWYHVAVCRVDGDLILYIDGDEQDRVANSETFHNSTATFRIGEDASNKFTQRQLNIDDVRITKSVGRYRHSFTSPTRPHSSIEVIPTSGEFTLEGFVRWETDPATAASIIAGQWNEGEDERGWQIYLNNDQLRFSYSTDGASGTVVNTDKAWNPAADVWYHWAITRDGSNDMRWFIDGTQIGSTSSITATFHDSSAVVTLGETEDHVTGSTQLYQAQFRATAGVARYVADFVRPAGPFVARGLDIDVGGFDPYWNMVAALLDYNVDAVENKGYWPDAETPTNMTRTTTAPAEGVGSLAAATDGYQQIGIGSDLSGEPGTGFWVPRQREFTFDITWFSGTVPLVTDTTQHDLISKHHEGGNDRALLYSIVGDNVSGHDLNIRMSDDRGPTGEESGTIAMGTLLDDTTYEISISRVGDDILLHLDGTYQGKFALSAGFDVIAGLFNLRIGQRSDPAATPDDLDGRFDQFRLTDGVSRRVEDEDYDPADERDWDGHYWQGGNRSKTPRIVEVTGTTVTSDTTTHTYNYPATVEENDLLLLVGAVDGSGDVSTYPTGFTEIGNALSDSSQMRGVVAWKAADGDEGGGTDSVTWGTSESGSWIVWRINISGWDGVTPPEIGSSSTGNTNAPTYSALTFDVPGDNYLVLGVGGNDRGDTNLSTVPTEPHYFRSRRQTNSVTTNATCWGAATVVKDLTGITVGNYGLTATRRWVSFPMAIRAGK